VGEPVPVHGLREDLRRGAPGRKGRLWMNRHELFTKATLRRHRRQAMLTVGGGRLTPHPWVGKRGGAADLGAAAGEAAGAGPRGSTTVAPARRRLEVGRIGDVVPRADGGPKVKGEFAYSSDLVAPGMLWGQTLRSPHAHARILALDIAEAVPMPGV